MAKSIAVLVWALALAACQTGAVNDINSPYYRIRSDSRLVLKQELNIPSGRAHVKFQHGTVVGGVDEYTINCEFRVRNLGPSVIQPESFLVTRGERPQEWVSQPIILRLYRVLYLKSDKQPDVLQLVCQKWVDPYIGRDVTVPEMREALGEYFVFEFAE
jgi:hypothetical protein